MENVRVKEGGLQILKGAIISLAVLLIGILVFSLIVKIADLNEGIIKAVNQFIKVFAIFIGCFFSVREGKGILKGLLIGLIFTILSYVIFSIMSKTTLFTWSFLIDIAFGMVIGAISGIIAVNVKK